jgi:hypothetical protein
MCLVCTQWVKQKMTIREAHRNAAELALTDKTGHCAHIVKALSKRIETASLWVPLDEPMQMSEVCLTEHGLTVELAEPKGLTVGYWF